MFLTLVLPWQMSLPAVAPGEQVIELMIPASKVGLIIGTKVGLYFRSDKRLYQSLSNNWQPGVN